MEVSRITLHYIEMPFFFTKYAIISLSYTQISLFKHYDLLGTVRYDKSLEGQVQTDFKEHLTVLITAQSNVKRRLFVHFVACRSAHTRYLDES